jgi:hypothetical protein
MHVSIVPVILSRLRGGNPLHLAGRFGKIHPDPPGGAAEIERIVAVRVVDAHGHAEQPQLVGVVTAPPTDGNRRVKPGSEPGEDNRVVVVVVAVDDQLRAKENKKKRTGIFLSF